MFALLALSYLGTASTADADPRGEDPLPIALTVGTPIEGRIEATTPPVTTATLTEIGTSEHPDRGVTFSFTTDEAAEYEIDLDAPGFRPYLVLRAADGQPLAEDGSALHGNRPRLNVRLEAASGYRVLAISRFGLPGSFTVTVRRGKTAMPPERKALAQAREAVAAIESGTDGESPAHAIALMRVAYHLSGSREDADEAKQLYARAADLLEASVGEHPTTARCALALALLQDQLGESEAEAAYRKTVEMTESLFGPASPVTAERLLLFGEFLRAADRIEEAADAIDRGLAIQVERLDPKDRRLARYLVPALQLHYRLGNHAKALDACQRVYTLAPHPKTLNSIGEIQFELGNYEEARPSFEQVERQVPPDDALHLQVVGNIAAVCAKQGDFAEALRRYQSLLETHVAQSGEDSWQAGWMRHNIGWCQSYSGRNKDARSSFEQAIKTLEGSLGTEHYMTAASLDNLGRVHFEEGRIDEAVPLLEQALEIRSEVLGETHPYTAFTVHNLGAVLRRKGEPAKAEPRLNQALELRRASLGLAHPDSAKTLEEIAMLRLDVGDTKRALEVTTELLASGRAQLDRILWSLTESERLVYAALLATGIELHLSALRGSSDRGQAAALAYDEILAWKGVVSRSLTQSRRQLGARLESSEAAPILERLDQVRAQLSKAIYKEEIEDSSEHSELLDSLRAESRSLESQLVRMAGRLDESDESIGLGELRDALPEESVVVDFFVHRWYDAAREEVGDFGEPRLSVWILKQGNAAPIQLDLGPAAEIEKLTETFLQERVLRGVAPSEEDEADEDKDTPGSLLFDALWSPIAEHIGEPEMVFLSGDSFLGTLPFEILEDEEGYFLVEKHGFVYLQDAASIVSILKSPPPEKERSLLAIGGVNYRRRGDLAWQKSAASGSLDANFLASRGATRAGGKSFSTLVFTRQEVSAVQAYHEDLFGEDVDRLTLQGDEPTEERLRYELPRHDIVHLATHGFFNELVWSVKAPRKRRGRTSLAQRDQALREVPKRLRGDHAGVLSGIVLAGANEKPERGREDGLLTAEEISWIDLSNVSLVTLSACQTGLGSPVSGEGMLGLRRTLRQAGAKSVISSLWKVQDESTSELMTEFYARLWDDGESKLEALRGAQIQMIEANLTKSDGEDAMPETWGAFIIDGDWR